MARNIFEPKMLQLYFKGLQIKLPEHHYIFCHSCCDLFNIYF